MLSRACGGLKRAFQFFPVPLRQRRACVVGALHEIQQRRAGRLGVANIVIHQKELAHILGVPRFLRSNRLLRETFGLRSGITIKTTILYPSSTRPPAATDNSVGISFAVDPAQN